MVFKLTCMLVLLLAILLFSMSGVRTAESIILPEPIRLIMADLVFAGATAERLDKFSAVMGAHDGGYAYFHFYDQWNSSPPNISTDGKRVLVTISSAEDTPSLWPDIEGLILELHSGRGWIIDWPGLTDWYQPDGKIKLIKSKTLAQYGSLGDIKWDPLDPSYCFITMRENTNTVFRIGYNGKNMKRVSQPNQDTRFLDAVDGGNSLLVMVTEGNDHRLYRQSRDRLSERQLAPEWQVADFRPDSKSPNERYLARTDPTLESLYLYDRQTQQTMQVVKPEVIKTASPGYDWNISLHYWTQDSRGIVYGQQAIRDRHRHAQIWYIGVGGTVRRIADNVELCGSSYGGQHFLVRCGQYYYLLTIPNNT